MDWIRLLVKFLRRQESLLNSVKYQCGEFKITFGMNMPVFLITAELIWVFNEAPLQYEIKCFGCYLPICRITDDYQNGRWIVSWIKVNLLPNSRLYAVAKFYVLTCGVYFHLYISERVYSTDPSTYKNCLFHGWISIAAKSKRTHY